jgi:hypothetical protein
MTAGRSQQGTAEPSPALSLTHVYTTTTHCTHPHSKVLHEGRSMSPCRCTDYGEPPPMPQVRTSPRRPPTIAGENREPRRLACVQPWAGEPPARPIPARSAPCSVSTGEFPSLFLSRARVRNGLPIWGGRPRLARTSATRVTDSLTPLAQNTSSRTQHITRRSHRQCTQSDGESLSLHN